MNFFDIVIIQPILNALILLYSIVPGGDFGVAIILFTIIIRFLLYPLTRSTLHQSRAMRKIQPELRRIKKQYKNNKQMAQLKQMELFKEKGINPFRSIGVLLIQLPIFIGLYYVIRVFTEQRDNIAKFTYDFLENIGPIKAIINNPDGFNERLFGFIDLTKPAIGAEGFSITLILLALIAAITQYWMSKQTMPHDEPKRGLREIMAEAAEGKQADQDEMNAVVMRKMMKVLPFFMFYIMLIVPGALALYYGTSNIVAVLQQHYLLKQDEEELDELASQPVKKNKKTTSKTTKSASTADSVVRISAKDTRRKRRKK